MTPASRLHAALTATAVAAAVLSGCAPDGPSPAPTASVPDPGPTATTGDSVPLGTTVSTTLVDAGSNADAETGTVAINLTADFDSSSGDPVADTSLAEGAEAELARLLENGEMIYVRVEVTPLAEPEQGTDLTWLTGAIVLLDKQGEPLPVYRSSSERLENCDPYLQDPLHAGETVIACVPTYVPDGTEILGIAYAPSGFAEVARPDDVVLWAR